VARGGCIVRTPVGDVDARVETKLERAAEVITAALGRS
jgi:flagellar biosynthesis/type III secretory pathway protein FliH